MEDLLRQFAVRVGSSALAGRGVFAERDFAAGELILTSDAHVSVVHAENASRVCHWCTVEATQGTRLSRCKGCGYAHYCGVDHQKAAWPLHKYECKAVRALTRPVLATPLLLAKAIWRAHVDNVPSWRNTCLEGLVESDQQLTEEHGAVLAYATQLLQGDPPDSLPALLLRVIANGFSLCTADMTPVGLALYPGASLVNHSCRPNAVQVNTGKSLAIRALDSIAIGTEITISYIDLMAAPSTRRSILHDQYGFMCQCSHCQSTMESQDDKLASSVEAMIAALDTTSSTSLYDACMRILDKCKAAGTELRGYAANIAMDRLISHQQWDHSLIMARHALDAMVDIYGPKHPLVAIQRVRIGKLCALEQEGEAAVTQWKIALPVLAMYYGSSHPLVRDVYTQLMAATEH